MKRLFLVSLLGFILVGCGEDKITNEYFVGEWNCEGKSYISKMENGKFSDYMREKDRTYKMMFKIENNNLYLFNESTNKWMQMDMQKQHSGETFSVEMNGFTMKRKGSLSKLSKEQFSISNEIIKESTNNIHDYDDKGKIEAICTRIK